MKWLATRIYIVEIIVSQRGVEDGTRSTPAVNKDNCEKLSALQDAYLERKHTTGNRQNPPNIIW